MKRYKLFGKDARKAWTHILTNNTHSLADALIANVDCCNLQELGVVFD